MKLRYDQRIRAYDDDDREYMETLVDYLSGAFVKDPQAVQAVIEDLVDGVEQAHLHGISAATHFGNTPHQAADAILTELPNRTLRQWLHLAQVNINLWLLLVSFAGIMRSPMLWRWADLKALTWYVGFSVVWYTLRGNRFREGGWPVWRNRLLALAAWLVFCYAGELFAVHVGSTVMSPNWLIIACAVMIITTLINVWPWLVRICWAGSWLSLSLNVLHAAPNFAWLWVIAQATFLLIALLQDDP